MWLWRKFCSLIYELTIKLICYVVLFGLIAIALPIVVVFYTIVAVKLLLGEKVRGYKHKRKS